MSELGFGDTPAIKVHRAQEADEGTEFLKGKETVKIHVTEQEGYPNYVFLQHNGDSVQVQRGVDVEVPVKFVDVLKDAICHRLVQSVVDAGRGDGSKRTVAVLKPFFVYDWHLVA